MLLIKDYIISYFSPENGRGCTQARYLAKIVRETKSVDTLTVIKFNNCATNTGVDSGCVVCLECELGKPFMWCPCMLHVFRKSNGRIQ